MLHWRNALLGAIGLFLPPVAAGSQSLDCANPGCETRISAACLNRVGAGSIKAGAAGQSAAADACAAEQTAYVACLTAVAETCGARPTPQHDAAGGCAPEDARQLYAELQSSQDAEALEQFAKLCAGTAQAGIAAMRAERLREKQAAQTSRAAMGLGQFAGQWVPPGFPVKGCPSQLLISAESGMLGVRATIDDKDVKLGFTKRMEYRKFLMRGNKELNFEGEPLAMTALAYTQDDGSVCRYARPR